VEEVKAGVKALIELGYWRWLDAKSPDEWPHDEPLPVEIVKAPLPPVVEVTKEQEQELLAFFGVTDKREGRVVRLSPRSDLSCPTHKFELYPDVCRSCYFLAG
jgi:hypothetical protein